MKQIEEDKRDMTQLLDYIHGCLNFSFHILHLGTALFTVGGTIFYFRYKKAIQRRKEKIKARLERGLVYRSTTTKPEKVIKALELNPKFVRKHASSWQMCSLGEYLSTLRFFTDDNEEDSKCSGRSQILEKELNVVIASLLLRALGERVGSAILPMLETKPADSIFKTLSAKIVSYMVAKIIVTSKEEKVNEAGPSEDKAALPMNVSEIMR